MRPSIARASSISGNAFFLPFCPLLKDENVNVLTLCEQEKRVLYVSMAMLRNLWYSRLPRRCRSINTMEPETRPTSS